MRDPQTPLQPPEHAERSSADRVVSFDGARIDNVSIGKTVAGDYRETIIHNPPKLSAEEKQEQRNRAALLGLVQRFWIEGVLHQSLHHQVLIELGMQARPDAVNHPWQNIVRLPNQAPQLIAPGQPISSVFDQANGRLLILGDPGGGKTTTLLTLAEQLIARAQVDETAPIPVVFQLSTWNAARLSLDKWLAEELKERYKVPLKLGEVWAATGEILPLLDGLDEIGSSNKDRANYVEKINAYLGQSGNQIVVCSRTAEYSSLGARLALDTGVEIQPLDVTQIDDYLARFGPPLAGLREAVVADRNLRELATSPLLLSVMALTYRNMPATSLSILEREEAYQQLWADYVINRFQQLRADAPTKSFLLQTWLIWLARGMMIHYNQVFYFDRITPSWLSANHQYRRFTQTVSSLGSLIISLCTSVVVGLFIILASSLNQPGAINDLTRSFFSGLSNSLSNTLLIGFVIGLIIGLIRAFESKLKYDLIFCLVSGFVGGIIGILLSKIFIGLTRNEITRLSISVFVIAFVALLGFSWSSLLPYKSDYFISKPQHFILRLFLLMYCGVPWNFAAFLDEAVSRNLMTRVGGGYRFYHRLLQEHFAEHEQSDLHIAPILGLQKGDKVTGRRAQG